MADTVLSGRGRDPSSDDRALCMVTYGLLFAAPFLFGLSAIAAVVIAYARKPEAGPLTCSHYSRQIRAFWISFVLVMLAAVGLAIGVGTLVLEIFQGIAENAPRDAWDAVGMEITPTLPATFFVGVLAAIVAYVIGSLWILISSLIGMFRLGGDRLANGAPAGIAAA